MVTNRSERAGELGLWGVLGLLVFAVTAVAFLASLFLNNEANIWLYRILAIYGGAVMTVAAIQVWSQRGVEADG